jgi:hypothetical protein
MLREAMKERPILFSTPMVRAILDGSKTQTRRVMKPQPELKSVFLGGREQTVPVWKDTAGPDGWLMHNMCPYGKRGDRLWVRETWGVVSHTWDDGGDTVDWTPDRPATPIHEMPFGQGYYSGHAIYAADGPYEWAGDDDGGGEPRSAWHPSIHMPRTVSRILLEILSVRVERLQDIRQADAGAEGAPPSHPSIDRVSRQFGYPDFPRSWYAQLWEQINGADSWAANPWVWVLEFRRVAP